MYRLNNIISKVAEYSFINDKLIYSKEHKLLLENEELYQGNISWFKTFMNSIYLVDNYKKMIFFNLKSNQKKVLNNIISVSFSINEDEIIYSHNSEDYTKQYKTRINLTTEQKKWTIESYFGKGKILDNDLYATCTNNRICKIDLNHPEKPLWQFDLSQFGTYYYIGDNLAYKVVQFIGIWNNLLLVQLTNARLIALDIKTGTLKKDLEIHKTNPLETPLFYSYYSKMHLVGDTIIWLSNQTLLHIDLHTFSTKHIKEYYSVPREEQWQFKKTTYFNGKLYFTADYAWQYVTPTHIGVMDANTGDVLWSKQLKKTGGLPEAPKVTKDKLYIKTGTAMLHIFEKDQNESV